MDIFAPITFLTDLLFNFIGIFSNRPRLDVKIIESYTDIKNSRFVYRASVINLGRVEARNCEGFWAIFDSKGIELSSGTSVYWSPEEDNDYDFKKRNRNKPVIQFNERRFCFAEIDMPRESIGKYFFPFGDSLGKHILVMIIEYGKYKAFDFIYLNILNRLSPNDSNEKIESNISWEWPNKLQHVKQYAKLKKHISKIDYHNYIRPV